MELVSGYGFIKYSRCPVYEVLWCVPEDSFNILQIKRI